MAIIDPAPHRQGKVERARRAWIGAAALSTGPAGFPTPGGAAPTRDVLGAIAMDLHDLVIQRLFAAGLSLEALRQHIPAGASSHRFEGVLDDVHATIGQLRGVIATTQRLSERSDSLGEAIEEAVASAAPSLGFAPRLRVDGVAGLVVPSALVRDVAAVLSEALSNVTRHAHATAAFVHVTGRAGKICVEVIDNGCGMGRLLRRSGLANLATRAARHGGTFELSSRPGAGTTLTWIASLP